MNTSNENNAPVESPRREFFKKVLFYTSAGVVVQALAKSVTWAAEELALIDMTKTKRKDAANEESVKSAISNGYVANLDAAIKAKKVTKADKPGAAGKVWKADEQTCENCALFNMAKATPPKATCALFPKVLVDAKGSCNSWSPKA